MKVINVNPLKVTSINRAIKELEAYKKMLKDFPEKYVRALSEYFYNTLNEQAPQMYDHWFMDTIECEDGKARGVFVFDGIVQFVEFGSGMVGSQNHGGINSEWLSKLPPPYNTTYESRKGGVSHHTDKQGNDYWIYPKNGKYYSTYGQKANPFIYRSVKELLDARASIGQALLNGADNGTGQA